MPQRTIKADDTVCACMGAPTITRNAYPVDMEECIYCGTAVNWDLVDDKFWGFGTKPCEHAKEAE